MFPITLESRYQSIAFVFLLIGVLLGLSAVWLAILRRFPTARMLALLCIGPITLCSVPAAMTIASGLNLPLLATLAFPGICGAVALGLCRYYRDQPPLRLTQLPLVGLLFVTLVVAGGTGLYQSMSPTGISYWLRDQYLSNLRKIPGIENVRVTGHVEDRSFRVMAIEFSLAGRPDTLIRVTEDPKFLNCASSQPLQYLLLEQIGPWKFGGRSYFFRNEGKPANYWDSPGLSIGTRGYQRRDFPFRLACVDDLIAHYDETLAILETWPDRPTPRKVRVGDEVMLEYWRVRAPNFPPNP